MSYTRQLAAIMFTDIAGYTAMMQHHEADALNKLHRFKEVLHTSVPAHQGEIIQYYGDGCLIIFKNAVDAVSCGKVLQETFALDPRVSARIGIHLGEVVFEEGNVFSDSVNIASRIESMGVPGAVLVSDAIYKQLKNKPEFQLTSLGSFEFKNVDEPLEVFALSNPGFPVPEKHELHGKFKERAPNKVFLKKKLFGSLGLLFLLSLIAGYFIYKSSTLPEQEKSIAVLAFTDMSPDKSQEYLSDGLAEDIITALSKIKDLKVIGRTSSFQFKGKNTDLREIGEKLDVNAVLEGSVQKSRNRIRVTAQLIDTKDGTHFWSQKWDKEIVDIFQIQDEIAAGISEKLKVTYLRKPEEAYIKVNPEAYELYLQARLLYHSSRPLNMVKAKELLLKSIAVDSAFSSAYAYLANTYRQLLNLFPPSEKEKKELMLDSVLYYAQKALRLNPEDPNAYIAMANWHSNQMNWIEIGKMLRKGIELNPGATEKTRFALFLTNMGYQEEAKSLVQEALLLEPLSREVEGLYLYMLMRDRKFDAAINTAKRYLQRDSTHVAYWINLASAYVGKKQYKDALNAWTRQHESYGNKTLADIYRTSDFKTALMAWLEMAKTNKVISPNELTKAGVYAMLEDKDNTLKHLELAVANNEANLATIKLYWLYDFVRNEPRFKELYRKLNFDAYDEYRKTLK